MTPEQITLVDAVAALLSLPLDPGCESHWSRFFTLPDGGKLYFSAGRKRGCLHISTGVPETLREHKPYYRAGEAPKTSIHVSDAKAAPRIVADIRRRLLPEHDREVAACTANKARHDDHNAKRLLALTQVAAPLGERIVCDEQSGDPLPLSIDRQGKFSLFAKPFCDSLKVEIETSPEIAGKIAALLATL